MTQIKDTYTPKDFFHPGETISEKIREMGISIKEFSVRTNLSGKTVFALLKGDTSITPTTALSLELVTNIPVRFWLKKQSLYDEYVARVEQQMKL